MPLKNTSMQQYGATHHEVRREFALVFLQLPWKKQQTPQEALRTSRRRENKQKRTERIDEKEILEHARTPKTGYHEPEYQK
jgi:hypothetical protein